MLPERTNSGNCIQNVLLLLIRRPSAEGALEIDKTRMSGDIGALSNRYKVEDCDIARTGTRRRKTERLPKDLFEYTIARPRNTVTLPSAFQSWAISVTLSTTGSQGLYYN